MHGTVRRWLSFVSLTALTALAAFTASTASARPRSPDESAELARQLASPDRDVRRSAEIAVIIESPKDADALFAALEKAGAPVDEISIVREARALAASLKAAPKDGVAFWSLLERVLGPTWRDLEPAILLSTEGAAQRAKWLAQRNAALDVVTRFCARGAMPAPPAPESAPTAPAAHAAPTAPNAPSTPTPTFPLPPRPVTPPTDPLLDELLAQGPRAVPHLLRALASGPWTSFVGSPGATFAIRPAAALDLGGAIVAVARLGAREAIPYLLFHIHGPSFTVESNAAAALGVLTGQKSPYKADGGGIDDTAVFAWWAKERPSHAQEVDEFVDAVLTALIDALPFLDRRHDFTEDYARFGQPVGATFAAVERIAGRSLGPVPEGSLEQRLAGIRRALWTAPARPAKVAPPK